MLVCLLSPHTAFLSSRLSADQAIRSVDVCLPLHGFPAVVVAVPFFTLCYDSNAFPVPPLIHVVPPSSPLLQTFYHLSPSSPHSPGAALSSPVLHLPPSLTACILSIAASVGRLSLPFLRSAEPWRPPHSPFSPRIFYLSCGWS